MTPMKFMNADTATGGAGAPPAAPASSTPPPVAAAPAASSAPDSKYSVSGGDPAKPLVETAPPEHWSHKFEGIEDKYKGDPSLLKYKSPAEVVKAYVNVQPLIGADKVPIPKDWNDQGQLDAFAAKVGRPEEKAGYVVGKYEFPEGFAEKTPVVEKFKDMAFKYGLSQWQFEKITKDYMEMEVGDLQAQQAALIKTQQEGMQKYENEVGTIRYQEEMQIARNAIRVYGGEEFEGFLADTGLNKDPRLMKTFAQVGKDIREGRSGANPGQQALFNAESSEAASSKIAELKKDKTFQKQLDNKSDPGNKAAQELWYSLHKKANPPKQK